MLVIGEKINTTREDVNAIVEARDESALRELAARQINAGAQVVDVNVGTRFRTEKEDMTWAIATIQDGIDTKCCIDSPSIEVLRAGLQVHRGKALLNSTTAEKKRLDETLLLIGDFECSVIALTMDDEGLPSDGATRLRIGERLIETLTGAGLTPDDIYIDPLVRPISTEPMAGKQLLEAIGGISSEFTGVHIVGGLSNVSFGLPSRRLLNHVFLAMVMAEGMDAVLIDPLDREIMATIIAAEALLGRDEYSARYVASFRSGKLGAT